MQNNDGFNPIAAARRIENSYREYIATTIHFADPDLQRQLEGILRQPGFLAKGPYLESAPPYRKGKTVRELVANGMLCDAMLSLGDGDTESFDPDRPLYTHQVKAIEKATRGRNYAVVTGTGSGKTECFLLPILNDILSEFARDGSTAGVRAMILYPMNALANDQLKRLRMLLKGTDITFGRYTGDTEERESRALPKWREENPGQEKLPNEIISREEIRRNPPNILLTNYSMLEYLLLRPDDAPLFGGVFGKNWRHIAIDEAHVYSGALGTEIAYLLRRLKARIESETSASLELHCYATSATIGSKEEMPKVAIFAQDLFGEPFESEGPDIDVISSEKDRPLDAFDEVPWGVLPLSAWRSLRQAVQDGHDASPSEVARVLSSAGVPESILSRMEGRAALLGLGQVLLGEESARRLVCRCEDLLDLTDVNAIGALGIDGLTGDREGVETLTAMVEVLSAAQRTKDVPILSSRYHSFLRAPEGIFLNLEKRSLTPYKKLSERRADGNETPVYEVSVCRHCGQAYILANKAEAEGAPVPWLNPRHEGTDADDEFVPSKYYRVLADVDEKDPDENIIWLCPVCGSLHDANEGGMHRFPHESKPRIPIALNQAEKLQADEMVSRCRHCGYQSRVAIQPMRVSPEAAGSVVCYELAREIPPFKQDQEDAKESIFGAIEEARRGGNVICFSDKRQDAAFFAPAMERTYSSITRRQLIREAVEAKSTSEEGCSPSSVINCICAIAEDRYPKLLGEDARDQATAWVLDELAAEDSRNSLDGLGVVRVEPTRFNSRFEKTKVKQAIGKMLSGLDEEAFGWLTEEDYILFLKVCLETLRERNAIEVPIGVSSLRNNFEKRGNVVICSGDGSADTKEVVRFAGASSAGPENKRSSFIRKYAKAVHGEEITREDAFTLLQSLFRFLQEYLGVYFSDRNYLVKRGEGFQLSRDIWKFYPHESDDAVYRCDLCGCETHLNTNGVCTTSKCSGHMRQMTFAEAMDKDKYYKEVYQEEALPLRIEEHTAQLSSKKAREIQSSFIKGDVNVLSCTTTFELGVDVGDLRAIFMRNVPPSTANYTQRAGRVGRRAGMPGYAITFARLRPHDLSYFDEPARIISGATPVPMCYLDNAPILMRHVFAVALSEFFRHAREKRGADCVRHYNDFLNIESENPEGMDEIRRYLAERPEPIIRQLERIVPQGRAVADEVGVEEWLWAESLAGEFDPEKDAGGRLPRTHFLKHADYLRVYDAMRLYEGVEPDKAASLHHVIEGWKDRRGNSHGGLKQEGTISVLAENGILPKYGFPTDLVELHLPELEAASSESKLSLSRSMRQAIREYAPGAEIVADKTLWSSSGIRKPRGQEYLVRNYGKCPECGAFVWPIDDFSDSGECPVCHSVLALEKKMIVPSYGFNGRREKKGIGLRRPRSKGRVEVHFSQHWPDEAVTGRASFPGGVVRKRYAGNGQLCVLNAPGRGFRVCERCGAASFAGEELHHTYMCKKSSVGPRISSFQALGAAFVSDVLELVFETAVPVRESEDWESVIWALVTAGARMLDIPETEIGGTVFENEMRQFSVMIYDDVPGGAGHARQLYDRVEDLIREAYRTVDGHCGCGEETCCYGCIANYYNQARQSSLSRGAAKRILGELLCVDSQSGGHGDGGDAEGLGLAGRPSSGRPAAPLGLAVDDGNVDMFSALSFSDVCEMAESEGSEEWHALIARLRHLGEKRRLEVPCKDAKFADSEGESAFAALAWSESHVVLLDEESSDDFDEAFGLNDCEVSGWRVFRVGSCTADEIADSLKEA